MDLTIANRKLKNNLAAPVLASAIVCLYAMILNARPGITLFPANAEFKEDINRDSQIDFADVVFLIRLGQRLPESPVADYNGDSVFDAVNDKA